MNCITVMLNDMRLTLSNLITFKFVFLFIDMIFQKSSKCCELHKILPCIFFIYLFLRVFQRLKPEPRC